MRMFLGTLCIVLASLLAWSWLRIPPSPQNRFAGVNIIFILGGEPGQTFSDSVYQGIRTAEQDLGCQVTMAWTHWERERLLARLKAAIAAKPDGICLMGFPGQEDMGPLVDEAVRSGIVVTSVNTEVAALEARYRREGFGFAGQEGFTAGQALAAKALTLFGIAAPARVLLVGSASVPGRGARAEGCLAALREAGIEPDYIDPPAVLASATPSSFAELFKKYLAEHQDVALVIQDAADIPSTAAILKSAGFAPGAVKLAGFDVSEDNLAAIESGYCGLLLDQQEFLEGYLPVLQVCLSRRLGFTGLHIETTGGFVDASNTALYRQLVSERR